MAAFTRPLLSLTLATLVLVFHFTTYVNADPIVTIPNGSYEGVYAPTFDQDLFLGIPYAQDAGGANRFRIPQALNETWSGTRDAKNYSNACPDTNPDSDALYGMSENCLSINVVRPAGEPLQSPADYILDPRWQLPSRNQRLTEIQP